MRFRAVFLDVYATLLEVSEIERVYQNILEQHGCNASSAEVDSWITAARTAVRDLPSGIGPDYRIDARLTEARREAQLASLLDSAGIPDGDRACRAALRDAWASAELFPVYPEVPGVLVELKRLGLVVGAVSNWESRLDELLASNGIAHHFDFILASEAAGYAKPSPRLFELALKLAGVAPGEALHAGDDLVNDVQAAQALGIVPVMVRHSGSGAAEHSPMISSLEHLLTLVQADAWLTGRVASGAGRAAGYTAPAWVREQFRERLGFDPYPGTLNLRIEGADRRTWLGLRQTEGVAIEPEPGYCAARCYRVSIEGRIAGAIVLPLVSGYPEDLLEVAAPVRLRDALGSEDGTPVTLALT